MTPEEINATQDEITFRRTMAYEVRRMAQEMENNQKKPANPPWWAPIILGIAVTACLGYIGMVHNEVRGLSLGQERLSNIRQEVESVKVRVSANETMASQIPWISQQVRDMNVKLDRIIERSMGPNR